MPLTNAQKQAAYRARRQTIIKSADNLHKAVKKAASRDGLAITVQGETTEDTLKRLTAHFNATGTEQPSR
jgi:hypothetical protein